MSDFSLGSFDLSREIQMEKYRAQEAERRLFGSSVLAEIEADNFQPKVNHTKKNNSSKQTNVIQDKLEVSKPTAKTDNLDDGKISFKEKIKNFGKGLVAPIKNIFSSPKNIAITAVSALACAAVIGLTGGAAAPVFVAAGLIGGGAQIIKGIQKQAKATTDAQAVQAWQDMGSGTFTVGVSALSAKASLKANGTDVSGMSTLKAAGKCVADMPKNISTGFTTAKTNVSNFVSGLKSTPVAPSVAPSASLPAPTSTSAPSAPTSVPVSSSPAPAATSASVPTTPVATSTPAPRSATPAATSTPAESIASSAPTSVPSAPIAVDPEIMPVATTSKPPLLLEAPKQQLLLEAPKTPIYKPPYAQSEALYPPISFTEGKLPIYYQHKPNSLPSASAGSAKPLLLEAPKGDVIPEGVVKPKGSTKAPKAGKTPKAKSKGKHKPKDKTGKISFWEKFKDFFRVFGFFKENPTVDCL